MQRLEVSGAVRPIYVSLGVKWLIFIDYATFNKNLCCFNTRKSLSIYIKRFCGYLLLIILLVKFGIRFFKIPITHDPTK